MKRIFYVFWCVIFCGILSVEAQEVDSECILDRTDRFTFYKSDCELTVAEVLSDLMKTVFDASSDVLTLSYTSSDAESDRSVITYEQHRYGYSTHGYAKLYVTNDIVERVEYRIEEATVLSVPNFIDIDNMLSSLKDSLGFESFTWEPFEYNGISYFVSKDTDIVLSIETVDLNIYAGTDSAMSLSFPDTTWLELTGNSYPVIDTVLTSDSLGNSCFDLHLKFRTRGFNQAYDLTIDALNGAIRKLISDSRLSSTGSGMTLYNSYRNFYTKWMGPLAYSGYILKDDVRGQGIQTKMYQGVGGPYDLRDPNNLWYGYNIGWDGFEWSPEEHKQAISVHWAVQKSWDYFYDIFKRKSIDDDWLKINVLVNCPVDQNQQISPYCNAEFRPSDNKIRFYESTSGCDMALTLDITGHEFTHGVSKYSVEQGTGFYPVGESGALDESFSDIFGCMIEYYTPQTTANWSIADQLTQPLDIRYLDNPNNNPNPSFTDGQPSWYGQPNYWLTTTSSNNNGGVHINSGVQNHWFYLLSEGGNSPQPGNTTTVLGIGREKAALITYRNLTEHMMSYSNYADARIGSILAAVDAFGACSFEVEQTINAWDAVNVMGDGNGLHYDLDYDCANLSDTYIYALRDLNVSCNYSNEPSYKALTAGRILTLEPGFESNSNMHLKIEPCFIGSGKMEEVLSYEGAGSVDNVVISETPEKSDASRMVVFPNPNNGNFAIRAEQPIGGVVYDMLGRRITVMQKIDEHTLYVSDLSLGTYVVRVQMEDGSVENAKVVVN